MKNRVFFAMFVFGGLAASNVDAGVGATNANATIRPISQYGLIQNVQSYSMNPFWNANSPYNQNFPQPVYATGPELNTSECQSVVFGLVSSYCASNNNCLGMRVSDVRPAIMLQLARLPGHNYASNCSGFIDTEFDSYVSRYSETIPNGITTFPTATVANPTYNASEFKLENPYERKDGTWQGEEWQKERRERDQELKELQSQNGGDSAKLAKANFPTTFADLSFSERMDIKQEGYEPFKDSSPYQSITVEDEEAYLNRLKASNLRAYCIQRPWAPECKPTASNNTNGTSETNENDSNTGNNSKVIHLKLG